MFEKVNLTKEVVSLCLKVMWYPYYHIIAHLLYAASRRMDKDCGPDKQYSRTSAVQRRAWKQRLWAPQDRRVTSGETKLYAPIESLPLSVLVQENDVWIQKCCIESQVLSCEWSTVFVGEETIFFRIQSLSDSYLTRTTQKSRVLVMRVQVSIHK